MRLIGLFDLSPKKTGSRGILRNKLRETFLKRLIVRTIAEEQCLTLVAETGRIMDIISRYKPNRVPLSEGLKLHQAALKVLKIAILSKKEGSVARQNFEKMAKQMEKAVGEIKKVMEQKTKGHLGIKQQTFFGLGLVGNTLIKNIMQTKGISEYTKIAFEKIDRIVEETLKGAKQ